MMMTLHKAVHSSRPDRKVYSKPTTLDYIAEDMIRLLPYDNWWLRGWFHEQVTNRLTLLLAKKWLADVSTITNCNQREVVPEAAPGVAMQRREKMRKLVTATYTSQGDDYKTCIEQLAQFLNSHAPHWACHGIRFELEDILRFDKHQKETRWCSPDVKFSIQLRIDVIEARIKLERLEYFIRRRLMERLLRYENHYSSGAEGYPPICPSSYRPTRILKMYLGTTSILLAKNRQANE